MSWEQRVMEDEPKFPASQDLPDVPYSRYAELLGLAGRGSSGPRPSPAPGVPPSPPTGRS